jgi:serine O-acetyltransferase
MDLHPLLEDALARLVRDMGIPVSRLPPHLIQTAHDDLHALLSADPSMIRAACAAFATGSAFRALLAYRVSSWLWHLPKNDLVSNSRECALSLSYNIRGETAIDIHPAATIGRRVVLDHGCGTVIGETASIGDECYILNGVLLGARGIANNPPGLRHPHIGKRCQIGSFAAIFGPVTVGDDCFIGPGVIIHKDVRAGSRITLRAIVQSTKNITQNREIEEIRRFSPLASQRPAL